MKTVIYSFIVGIFFLGFVSCKSPKVITVEQATGRVEVKGPFDEPKFRTDKDFFRSYQSYKHPNETTARTYAATLA